MILSLLWDIEQLRKLNANARKLVSDVTAALDLVVGPRGTQQSCNLPQKLSSIRSRLCDFTKGLFHFKRVPASHIFCVMISSELRKCKPYAIPVQCLPYAALKEQDIRQIVNNLIEEMVKLGMKVAGRYYVICFS